MAAAAAAAAAAARRALAGGAGARAGGWAAGPAAGAVAGAAAARGALLPAAAAAAGAGPGGARGKRGGPGRQVQGYTPPAQMLRAAPEQGKMQVEVASPGLLAEPYRGDPVPLPWSALFTRSGWQTRWGRWIGSLRSMYTLARCTRDIPGFGLHDFKVEVSGLYRGLNERIAAGDKPAMRRLVTEKMYSLLKKEVQQRERGGWHRVDWGMKQPPEPKDIAVVQGRLIQADESDQSLAFAQLTCRIQSRQTCAVYGKGGRLVSGEPGVEVEVVDHWVFERLLKRPSAKWSVAARLPPFSAP